jgi:Tfp pilus assembly protein PilN
VAAWIIGISVVLLIVGLMTGFVNLAFLGMRTNMETHITRQTNGYLTAHQTALREMKAQYDDLERQAKSTNDADTLDAIHSQERGIARQMHEEADLIPNDVQPDIQVFLTSH